MTLLNVKFKALNLSKDLDHNGQNSWFSSVRHLCTILNLPADFAKLRKRKFTQLFDSQFSNQKNLSDKFKY
jgi:hypothetical protein